MISVQTLSSKPLYSWTTPGYTFATPYDYPKSPIPLSIDSQFTPATNSSSILPLASSKQMETLMYCRQDQNGAFHEDISLWICGRQDRGGTRRVDSTGNRRRKMRLTRAEGRLIISKDASAASGDGCIWRISLVGLRYVSIGWRPRELTSCHRQACTLHKRASEELIERRRPLWFDNNYRPRDKKICTCTRQHHMLETMKPSYMVTRVPAGTFLNYVRSILTSSAKHDPRIMVSSSTWSMTREIVFFFLTLRHVRFRIRCEESRYESIYFCTFSVIVVSSLFFAYVFSRLSVWVLINRRIVSSTAFILSIEYSLHRQFWLEFYTGSILSIIV